MCRYRAVYTRDMKKYKLTKESIEWCGKTLFRIEAVAAFGTVAKGEKGGFIENEENLSQDNDAWVYDNAQVSGNARVYGELKILAGFFFGIRYKKEEIKYKQVDEDYELIYKGEAKFDETEESLSGKEVTVTVDGKEYKAKIV